VAGYFQLISYLPVSVAYKIVTLDLSFRIPPNKEFDSLTILKNKQHETQSTENLSIFIFCFLLIYSFFTHYKLLCYIKVKTKHNIL